MTQVSDFMERHFAHLRDGRKEYTEAEVRSIILAMETENSQLRAQLAESESERLEQARLLGMSAERELALRAETNSSTHLR